MLSQGHTNNHALLGSVRGEIDSTMSSVCNTLESYAEKPDDEAKLHACADALHQVHGALQILELYGAATLVAELETLTAALINNKVRSRDDTYEVLMRGMIQLPNYLEFIQQGNPDYPIIFLPLLNDLRAARNAALLSEGSLFSPNLEIEPPSLREKPEATIDDLARKFRHSYHLGLLDWFRDNDMKAGLQRITVFLTKLRPAAKDPNTGRILWVANGLVEGLRDEGINPSVAVKMLMGHLDKQFKKIIDGGALALSTEAPKKLLKNLLYYVASSRSTGHYVSEIKDAFNLSKVMPDQETLQSARMNLSAPSSELIESVSSILLENLAEVKIHLDVFMRSSERDPKVLTGISKQLAQMCDALDMIGHGSHRTMLQEQISILAAMGDGNRQINEKELIAVADVMVVIETELSSPKQHELVKMVIDEIKIDFTKVKDAFNEDSWEPEKPSPLQGVPNILDRVRGSLELLTLDRGANVLTCASSYVQSKMINTDTRPDENTLDLLANTICSVEYYLELLIENSGQQDAVLDVAEQSLKELGVETKVLVF